MGKIIIMQETVNLMAIRDPEGLKALGENWDRKQAGDTAYFVDLEPQKPEL